MQVRRYDAAADLLAQHLGAEPDDVRAHCWRALSLLELERYDDAAAHFLRAIQLGPDDPYPWFVGAHIDLRRHRADDSEKKIVECLRLDPYDADAFGLWAAIGIERRDWRSALDAAERGLAIDPEHDACTNLRATALTNLGRRGEAAAALQGQLARTPNDALTHANQGWTEMHRGDHVKALEHFQQALRSNPTLEWARTGVLEALKARYWPYRITLRYFLWMSRLSARWQFWIIFGGWILYRAAFRLAETDGPLAPLLWVLVGLYLAFAASSWFAVPIGNLLLCLNRYGRLALTRWEKVGAATVTGLLVAAGCGIALGWKDESVALLVGLFALFLSPVVKLLVDQSRSKARLAMAGWLSVVVLIGVAWVVLALGVRRTESELRPIVDRYERIEAARSRLESAPDATATERRDLRRDIDELNADLERANFATRVDELKSDRSKRDVLLVIFAVFGFIVSQLVAGLAARWAERR